MTQDQIRWALSHDWALYPTLCGRGIQCRDEYVLNGVLHVETVTHFDFATLRAWAGY